MLISLLVAIVFLNARQVYAEDFNCSALLNGAQNVPSVATAGSGFAKIIFDSSTGVLSWNITFSSLSTPATVAHFHGPAAAGSNAPVLVAILPFPAGATSGSVSGSANLNSTNAGRLLGGLVFVNIHTTAFPGGEIRGQVSCQSAGPVVGGELVSTNAVSLFIAGVMPHAIWVFPIIAGAVTTIAFGLMTYKSYLSRYSSAKGTNPERRTS